MCDVCLYTCMCVYVNVWCVFACVSGYYLYTLYFLGNCSPMEPNPVPRTFWALLLRYSLLCFKKYLLKLKYEYAFYPLLKWLKTARMYHEENPGSAWWLVPHCQQSTALVQSWRSSGMWFILSAVCVWKQAKAQSLYYLRILITSCWMFFEYFKCIK